MNLNRRHRFYKVLFSILASLLVYSTSMGQQWQVGAEIGASFVSASDFDVKDNLRTVFPTPGVYVQYTLRKNWFIGAHYTRTRFDYYNGPSTIEEYDAYTINASIGRRFLNNRLEAELGLGILHGVYFLNDAVINDFSAVPSVYYQLLPPRKQLQLKLFARYPLVFSSTNVWGFFSTGISLGFKFPPKKGDKLSL